MFQYPYFVCSLYSLIEGLIFVIFSGFSLSFIASVAVNWMHFLSFISIGFLLLIKSRESVYGPLRLKFVLW